MKKSVKILTLVLSLALICGALVVAAFANEETAVVGVRLDNYADFENAMVTEIPTAESANAGNKQTNIDNDAVGSSKAVAFKHQKGGKAVLLVNPVDNNTYLTVDWTQNPNTSSGHFLDTYTQKSAWTNYTDTTATAEYFGTDTKYFVMDVDLKWDDPAKYDGTGFFYPYAGYTISYTKNGSETFAHKAITNDIGLRFPKTADGKVGVKIQNDTDVYEIGSDGTWSHVTYIMGFEKVEDDDGTNLVLKQWLAIDGVIVDNYNWTNNVTMEKDAHKYTDSGVTYDATLYKQDRTLLYTKDIRFDAFGRKDTSGSVDNYMIRTLTSDYNGNLGTVLAGTDLTAWESAVYTADYKMPFGELVAMLGETPYDDMAKAFADAEDGDTITLKTNLTDPVVFDKAITVEGGEYTIATYSAAEGYMVVYDEETNTYTVETAQGELYITWESCTCGRDDCDETHPGGFDTVGWEGGSIAAAYAKNEEGKTLNWTLADGYVTYYIAGWVDEDGEPVDVNTVITAEMCDDLTEITLTPVIGTLSSAFCYTKGDDLAFTDDFMVAVNGVTEGGTITLLKDAEFHGAGTTQYTLSKSMTIDLNGNTFNTLVGVKISGLFKFGTNKTYTIKGEKEGSTIVSGYPRGADSYAGGTLFTSGTNSTLNLVGPNLQISTAAFFGNWGTGAMTFNFDGVTVNCGPSFDNMGFIYHKGDMVVNVKNSTIYAPGAPFVSGVETKNTTLNIENCVFLTTANRTGSYRFVNVNIKDSYVFGKLEAPGAITVAGECYFTDNSWIKDDMLAEGLAVTPIFASIEHALFQHTWKTLPGEAAWDYEATTATAPGTLSREWTYTTSTNVINVNVADGDTALKTIATVPGAKVLAYEATGVSLADGWVNKTTKYWYTVDKTATADVDVDIADITDRGVTYAVGAPELYFNHALNDNLTSNLYVPAELPEGVEITNIDLYYGSSKAASGRKLNGNYIINDKEYQVTQGWPQPFSIDEGVSWVITYTYEGETLTYTAGTNIVAYAKKVAEVYNNDTEKMTQMTALLQYVEAANKINGGTISNGVSEYLAELKPTYTLPAADAQAVGNLIHLRSYFTGAKMTVVAGKGGAFAFTLNAETTADVTFKIYVPVEDADPRVINTIVKDGQLIISSEWLGAWGAKDFNIDVLDAEGQVLATGTYSLAAYKAEMAAMATEDELSLLDAIYAIAAIGSTID